MCMAGGIWTVRRVIFLTRVWCPCVDVQLVYPLFVIVEHSVFEHGGWFGRPVCLLFVRFHYFVAGCDGFWAQLLLVKKLLC